MNTPRLLTAFALLPTAFACAGVIPGPFPAARYEKMFTDSPFALATITGDPKGPPEPSWSANLILGPVYRIVRNGEEREYAVVKSKGDITGSFTLTGHDESPDGIQLVKIEWADDITKTKAVVKKGAEFATLEADQTAAPIPMPQVIQNRPNGQPGVPNNAANSALIRRPGQPAVPPPVIPRPTTAVPPVPPQYNQNNQNNQNANDRRRIRVINSK